MVIDTNEVKSKLQKLLNDTSLDGGINGKVKIKNLDEEVLNRIDRSREIKLFYPNETSIDIVTGKTQPVIFKIVDDLNVGNNVFLYGPAGTGKTTLAKTASFIKKGLKEENFKLPKNPTRAQSEEFKNKIPYVSIACNQWTSPTRLIGGQTIEGYVEGDLIHAWEKGKLLILDELPKLDPNTAGVLNEALAEASKKDAIIFTGEGRPVQKHPDFCVIATGNTTGKNSSLQYGGNNKQDASLIDRFSGSYYAIDFDKDLEKSLVFRPVFNIMNQMRSELIKIESDEIITLRTMLNMNRIYFLEMERQLGNIPENKGSGKTLKDSLESFLSTMDKDERKILEGKIDMETFYNTYANNEIYLSEKKRFNIK